METETWGARIQPGPRLPPAFVKETENQGGKSSSFQHPWSWASRLKSLQSITGNIPPCGGFVSHSPLATCYVLYAHFPFPPPSRTSQTQRTRAPGTASRTWPPSCPSCLGSRRTGWNCTIRTGTPPPPTHPTPPRGTFRLRCEEAQPLSDTCAHASPPWTPERLYISEFLQRFRTRHTPSPPMCSVGSDIVFVYHRSGQTRWKGDCSTIYFRKKTTEK